MKRQVLVNAENGLTRMNGHQKRDEEASVSRVSRVSHDGKGSAFPDGYGEKLTQVYVKLQGDGATSPYWRLRFSGYEPEQVKLSEYVRRLHVLLSSDDGEARREAMAEIDGRLEGRR